ncbi:MAG: tripartite tricarboxylate transporter TctB family protein [Pseudomonadota bacterium]
MSASPQAKGIWIELVVWLGLTLVAFVLTFQFSAEVGSYAWGAASWPRAIILMMALGAVVQCLFRLRQASGAPAAAGKKAAALPIKLLLVFGVPLLYVFLLPRTGFYVTTPFFLLAYLMVLGERRPKVLIGVSLLIYVLINLLFSVLFFVALPTGTWPGFYDFSNWLVSLLQ